MTYKCFGNNLYEFTLVLYRDCNCTNCAQFEQNVSIGVYACGNNVNCSSLTQARSLFVVEPTLFSVSTINNPDVPGYDLPEQCLQAGAYKFTLTLPVNTENYYIIYQRCCRPETVSNIPDPQMFGMSIFTEIKPNAAAGCNNTPVFQESISPVFCLGETFEIDHSAIDSDGDSLVYSICSSFKGAGIDGGPQSPGSNPNTCTGLIPTPSCPPPFNFVDYAPGFSGANPLGPDSQFSINPQTGLITVNPSIAGQYLVTICVKEYRNGLLINTAYREFTYLAAACQTTSTNENQKFSGLMLFPNPANNSIHISLEKLNIGTKQIQIFNSYGKFIDKFDLDLNDLRVDISEWPAGLYTVLLLQNGKVLHTGNFVKIQ